MKISIKISIIIAIAATYLLSETDSRNGFGNAIWGMSPDLVKKSSAISQWKQIPNTGSFPSQLSIDLYETQSTVAGYPCMVRYYFYTNRFFQATVSFDFGQLKTFDFNYNVFISVDRYYRAIHDQTQTFVFDIYDLLQKKYGKKAPVFKGLDPRLIFTNTDAYLGKEVWNLRYHPYEYYTHISASAYAQWDFPKTRVILSISISAKDTLFDYSLSCTSMELEKEINSKRDSLRMQGL